MIYWLYVDGHICSQENFDHRPSKYEISNRIKEFAEKHGISTEGITMRKVA